jgi:hypothetical protein
LNATPLEAMPRVVAPFGRRRLLLGLALGAVAGCSTTPQRTQFDSHLNFERTFNTVMGAMADEKMTFSVQDRRHGLLVAQLNGDTVQATMQPNFLDSTVRVQFSAVGDKHTDEKLLMRVVEAYRLRMTGQARILPPGTL